VLVVHTGRTVWGVQGTPTLLIAFRGSSITADSHHFAMLLLVLLCSLYMKEALDLCLCSSSSI
jgi:hypothetical protein